ncbi:MAG: hypothetical protein WD873_04215 [Candidatus Hydrogenedentales bacterium]
MIKGLFAILFLTSGFAAADDVAWSAPVEVKRGDETAVTYRAALFGDVLVVEAEHAKDWHTYSMDNLVRAREKTGSDTPATELPTRIEVGGGLGVIGPWHQTAPKDLSDASIEWYTWGFEDVARFAVKVRKISDEPAIVTINAQSCNATSCAMVEGVRLEVPAPEILATSEDELLAGLKEVETNAGGEN